MDFETAYRNRYILARTFSNFLIIFGIFFLFFSMGPILKSEIWYKFKELKGFSFTLESKKDGVSAKDISPFGLLLSKYPPIKVDPVNRDFSIVIEKIAVNAPVVADVDVADREKYLESLKYGVAQAKDSARPGEIGNTYLFAHSALDFWNFGKYAKVFTLLGQVGKGDRVVLFYGGRRFDYVIESKEVFKGFDLTPLLREFAQPTLTLQTCDPPGTALNRLVVTARLVKEGT